jgi:ABC-type transport system involved in cytochrome c biogenesis permease subunit
LGLGFLVHTVYLVNHGFSQGRFPVSTMFDSMMLLAWILAAIELYFLISNEKPTAIGLFLTPLVLAVVLMAGLVAPRGVWSADWGGPTKFWGTIHGILLVAGAVSTFVAFAAGLMYVAQSRRLKRKRPSKTGLTLPSLEQSERINRIAITISFPTLTFGLFIGVMLNYTTAMADGSVLISWTDPKLVSAAVMWLVFAALLHARFRPAMRGRRVVWLTGFAFGFLVFTWVGVGWLVPTAHGSKRSEVQIQNTLDGGRQP